jgi:hypothetical protein
MYIIIFNGDKNTKIVLTFLLKKYKYRQAFVIKAFVNEQLTAYICMPPQTFNTCPVM